ncbi:MAG TPA: preprotein translocase subunit YajC [Rudaea sp.]|nr:preprotein translocase subunit YajC [Rudaea sp.]
MDFLISSAYAQASGAPASPGVGLLGSPIVFIVIMVAMMFFMFRSQSKRQKELKAMIAALAKGDEVVSNGGIAGRIDAIGESFVSLEIAPDVRIKLQKTAISMVLPKGSLKNL